MNELLTACANPDEAYEIFGRAVAGLFPSLSGALHIFAASRNQLTPAATWGTWPDAATPASPESCWGLRRGKCYVGNGTTTPPCGHAGPARELATLCAPLTASGEVLGLLHLRGPDAAIVQSTLQLATMAADGLALNLANLRLRESLKAQSIRDPLTDLFNRRYLTETLAREFARVQRAGAPMAVIMLDVDHFKRFNDTFGHDAGDAVLRELGAFLRQSMRAEDIACRYGGEEFCLVLPQMDRDGARERAELIRTGAARLEVKAGGRTLDPVTLSLGVAMYPENGADSEALLRAADAALYLAKRRRTQSRDDGPRPRCSGESGFGRDEREHGPMQDAPALLSENAAPQ
jgi:diguanylate cyclase (GGDEF)-like protein